MLPPDVDGSGELLRFRVAGGVEIDGIVRAEKHIKALCRVKPCFHIRRHAVRGDKEFWVDTDILRFENAGVRAGYLRLHIFAYDPQRLIIIAGLLDALEHLLCVFLHAVLLQHPGGHAHNKENVARLIDVYEKFLELNKGFVATKTNSSIKLPKSLKSADVELLKKYVDEVTNSGNLHELVPHISEII